MNSTLSFNLYKLPEDASAFELELELDGMFRRWKLPLGPSMNPNKNRIAHETTSSPEPAAESIHKTRRSKKSILNRQLIDSGVYEPIAVPIGKDRHQELLKNYKDGRLALLFHGNYLRGGFSLAKFIHDNSYWLLVKKADMFASTKAELVSSLPEAKPTLANTYSLTKTYAHQRSAPLIQLPPISEHGDSNLQKPLRRGEHLTTQLAINYYAQVSPYILPFLQYDEKALLRMVIEGVLEFETNLPPSKGEVRNLPMFSLIRLEGKKIPMSVFVHVLQSAYRVLDSIGLPHAVKTSKDRSFDIAIPLGKSYSWDQARQFSDLLAFLFEREAPDYASIDVNPQKRRGKIFLHTVGNSQQTVFLVPYSIIHERRFPVSTPILPTEITNNLQHTNFAITTVLNRLKTYGDIWGKQFEHPVHIETALENVKRVYNL